MDTPTASGAIIICSSLDRFLDHCQRYDVTTVGVDGRVTQGVVLSFTTNLWSDITLTAFGRIDRTLVALGARIPVEDVWCVSGPNKPGQSTFSAATTTQTMRQRVAELRDYLAARLVDIGLNVEDGTRFLVTDMARELAGVVTSAPFTIAYDHPHNPAEWRLMLS